MKVKICGITNAGDAQLAESLGADYVGLIFAKGSARCIDVSTAADIAESLAFARLVGVFVEQSLSEVEEIAQLVGLDAVQLYRRPRRRPQGVKYIQAIRVRRHPRSGTNRLRRRLDPLRGGRSLRGVKSSIPDYFLVDTYHETAMGGTGDSFEWSVLPSKLEKVFLSGGINVNNVRLARRLNPYAIDVCSSVECRPGIKDHTRLERLFEEVRA